MRRRVQEPDRSEMPFALPGLTPEEAAWALVERSALTWAELLVLESAATGAQDGPLDLTTDQAAALLARWRGPIRGLRLLPLPHWGTAWVRGGAPYDRGRRERPTDTEPFANPTNTTTTEENRI